MNCMAVAILLGVALAGGLAGCTLADVKKAETIAAVTVPTLAKVAADNSTTAADLVAKGQLFCQQASGIVAAVDAFGNPTSVIGQTSSVVADVCHDISGVPVPPPSNPAATPIAKTTAAGTIAIPSGP